MLHGVDMVPLNIAFSNKGNVHFVRIDKSITAVRHIICYREEGSAYGMSLRVQAFFATELLCSGTR